MIRVQEILKDCEALKSSIIQNDTIDWSNRLRLQNLYEEAILADMNYCVDRQIEQMLWNSCFKSCFDFLQNKLKFSRAVDENVKLPGDEDESAFLSTFLKASLSYFDRFMQKIEFSSRTNDNIFDYFDQTPTIDERKNLDYLLHFCLIHLGDISRYRKRFNEAELFYLNATNLCPANGHAFNQLAILETCRNRQLSALYFYYRSLYVENSFLLSASNLDKFFSTIDISFQSMNESSDIHFEDSFYKFLACIHNNEHRKERMDCHFKRAIVGLQNDVNTMSMYDFFHVAIILIANIWKINPNREKTSLTIRKIDVDEDSTAVDFSKIEKIQLNLLVKFIQYLVKILLRTSSEKFDDIPIALIILLEWIREYSGLLTFNEFCGEKSEFLYRFCSYLNRIQEELPEESVTNVVLPEDKDLIGFQPLETQLSRVKMNDGDHLRKLVSFQNPKECYSGARKMRFIVIGKFLTEFLNDDHLLKCSIDESRVTFESSVKQEDILPEDLSLEVPDNFINSQLSDNVTLNSTPPSETSKSRRQTKVLPLLGLAAMDSTETERKLLPTAKFKIAPAGSKVEMVLKGEVEEIPSQSAETESDVDENKLDNQDVVKCPRENKYELPPRFQAAKLKHALSGALSSAPKNRSFVTSRQGSSSVELTMTGRSSQPPLLNLNPSLFRPLMNIPPPPLPPIFNRVPGAPRMMQPPNDASFLAFRGSHPTFGQPMEFRPNALSGYPMRPPPPPNFVNNFRDIRHSGFLESSSRDSSSTPLFESSNEIWPPSAPQTMQNENFPSRYNLFPHTNPELQNKFSLGNFDESTSSAPMTLSQTPLSSADSNTVLANVNVRQQNPTFELFDGKNLFSGPPITSLPDEEIIESSASFSLFADSK